jgi:ATP-binding protein involved in chromosome partitioning
MANRPSPQEVLQALKVVVDPQSGRNVADSGLVLNIEVGDRHCIVLLKDAGAATQQLVAAVKDVVEKLGFAETRIQVVNPQGSDGGHAHEAAHAPGPSAHGGQPNLIPGVKAAIAVASGKGGVGKSTVAANLAVALRQAGAKVGLMDTDVYGPSVPMLMGGKVEPAVVEGKLEPPVEHGVKIISMAYFLPKNEAVIWRGPMLHKTIQQFLGDVRWGELDYLVMDLPPGTGDIQLSVSQSVPLTGAVIVSTPQDLALTVASKAIAMFEKLNVPILGIVENMSYYVCRHCGERDDIFGHGGAREAAEALGFPFLGEVPLETSIRQQSDSGTPVVLGGTTATAQAFAEIAAKLAGQVAAAQTQGAAGIEIE